ncbi:PIG-L family deacetylase [Streptomyces venezuelae]|uniref:PIG-L family deacetylase n=1 Tax=Streptomyces venezuelae TaxID=54571 RepID=A0A5P2BJ19_STRVZ|nr:PIG-L family deacetylase [Streptomyces venezuelae]QES29980.1 PIG-L family deacetylase [Streptomyces venezuelae]
MPPEKRLLPRTRATRRNVLAATVLGAMTPVGVGIGLAVRSNGEGGEAPAVPHQAPDLSKAAPTGTWAASGPQPQTTEAVVQIVAHPDDDLFFINPEVGQSLRSGRPLTTIYLTSGESNGVNGPRAGARTGTGAASGSGRGVGMGASQTRRPTRDKHKYAKARQNGIRAAYAEMVTGRPGHPWRRTVIATAGGGQAELDTLQGYPHIQLVWTLLHEAGSITGDRPHSLHGLWEGRIGALGSQLAYGGPVTRDFSYTKEQLIQTLTGYLKRFRPTQVRMQNPTPGRLDRNLRCSDHQDHRFGARFVQQALARYAASGSRPHFTVQTYMGYFNGGLPQALDPASGASKARTLATYSWSDDATRDSCEDPAGCGDLKVAASPKPRWSHSIHHAGDTGADWLLAGKDDSLWAFAVLDGRIAYWHRPGGETGKGSDGGNSGKWNASRWKGPVFQPETGVDTGVRPTALPDGRIAVFGTRTLFGDGSAAGYGKEVGYVIQSAPGEPFGPWQSLGTPELSDEIGTNDISSPAVVVDRDGAMSVFLRDSTHQLTTRAQQPDGTWTPWRALGGKAVHSDPVAATDRAGRAYVLAATPHTVLAWIQDEPGAEVRGPLATGLPATTLPLTVRRDDDGVRVFYRAPNSGNVCSARLHADALTAASSSSSGPGRVRRSSTAHTSTSVTDLGGAGGYGPVSATSGDRGDVLLAARTATGDVATAWGTSGRARTRPQWNHTGVLLAGAPSSAALSSGGVVLTMLGLDSRLYWTHATRGGGRLAPWQPVGSPTEGRSRA